MSTGIRLPHQRVEQPLADDQPKREHGAVTAADRLARARVETLAQIDALVREFDQVVAAAQSANGDDEHDPEGATVAFERQQVAALLDSARRRLADVDDALARIEAGEYGTCASCGRPIAPERLAARPSARTCIACAT